MAKIFTWNVSLENRYQSMKAKEEYRRIEGISYLLVKIKKR
jgi:hypothetical protein